MSGKAKRQADREKAVLIIGNTKGIAQVDDQITVETPEPEATDEGGEADELAS